MFSLRQMRPANVCKLLRTYSSQSSSSAGKAGSAASSVKDVPGLSSNVVVTPAGEVGPGASKSGSYKNPEYFCYNTTSYFEAEVEMLKYRLPQPSPYKK